MSGTWFGNFMMGSKLRIGFINKHYFGVNINVVKYLLIGCQ